MKKLLLLTLLLSAGLLQGRAQFTTFAGNTMYFQQILSDGSGILQTFPPLPATGQVFWMHDAAFGGTVPAIMGINFVYTNVSGVQQIDVAQPDWSVTSSTAAGFIKNKPTISTKLVQNGSVTTDASGNVTWTYPVAYPIGVVPNCSCLPTGATTTNLNVQKVSATNTSITFKVWSLPQTSILGIVVLGAPAAGASISCDVLAVG